MATETQAKKILAKEFPPIHVGATLNHFSEAIKKYQRGDWEGSLLKIGKFVEAIMKCLAIHCGQTLPRPRNFKVGVMARDLGRTNSSYDDVVRILIPKACIFIYDIVSNRGVRHDPYEVDPNEMDANVAIPVASWILAELIRFSSDRSDLNTATLLVKGLSDKKYPYFEEIDGRTYINIRGLCARDTGLLILNAIYPKRINREFLIDLIKRHGFNANATNVAVHRLKTRVDDDNDNWKLRGIGLQEVDKILSEV